jgi:molybdopterin/thiamine biosynthesis adenylyltransferase
LAERDPKVRELSQEEVRAHGSNSLAQGWRIGLLVGDDVHPVDVLLDDRFPFSIPRVALAKTPPPLTWPHAEPSLLCLYDELTSTDVFRPAAVLEAVLDEASRLIARNLRGETEDDFRTEFVTYWDRFHVLQGSIPWRSLISAKPPSRLIRVWKGTTAYLVGEDDASVQRWLDHFFDRHDRTFAKTDTGLLLWLTQPLLPKEYPKMAEDVVALSRNAGPESARLLEQLADETPSRLAVLLGAYSADGPCLAGVTILKPERGAFQKRPRPDPLTRGFRMGHVPKELLRHRYLAGAAAEASAVSRVDARWIHGRDRDARQEQLSAKHVVLLGCGSLGAPIAIKLAGAGVGTFALVDPQALTAPNTSRHPLGGREVGKNKAAGLRQRLEGMYPHIASVNHHEATWQEAFARNENLFAKADLVIVAIGSWHAEAEFNDWHLRHGRAPHALYVWTEPRAGAGHAIAIGPEGGCFHCGFDDSGGQRVQITHWPEDVMREREPGCGAIFQPYGPAELTYIEALGSELAIDVLLYPPRSSIHRMWAADRQFVERSKGSLNPEWVAGSARRQDGGCREEEHWARHESCAACRSSTPT